MTDPYHAAPRRAPASVLDTRLAVRTQAGGTAAPTLALERARGSAAAPAAVQGGDALGSLAWAGFDGGAHACGAAIQAVADGAPGPSEMPARLVLSTRAQGSAAPAERMRIAPDGTTSLAAAPGTESLRVLPVAGAINRLQVAGAAAATRDPVLSTGGADAAVGLVVQTKGGGEVRFLSDAGGPEQFRVGHTPGAVNRLSILGAVATDHPYLAAGGSGSNVGINLKTKGTGQILFRGGDHALAFAVLPTASAANHLQAVGAAAGAPPTLTVQGSDADVGLRLAPKGGGHVWFGTYAAGSAAATGTIEIRDAGGTVRRLLCA